MIMTDKICRNDIFGFLMIKCRYEYKNAALYDLSHIGARKCNMTIYMSKIKQILFNQHANYQSHHTYHNNFLIAGSNKIKYKMIK